MADSFRLGVVCDPVAGHERFEGMLCIPYLTPGGVVAVKFRSLDPESDGPKYDSPAGQKPRLYNAQSLSDGGEVAVVVEGELGALVAQSTLSVPSVGTPGTQWQDHWARCFSDFDRVVIVADHDAKENGDDPGVKHARKVQKLIEGSEVVLPPPGHDLDEWLARDGVDVVRKAMGI